MRDDLKQLLHLQNLDERMVECRNEKSARLRELEMLGEKVERTLAEAEKEKKLYNQGQVTLKDLELQVAGKRSHIEKLKQHSSMIRNNREYQAAMQEIGGFEKDIRLLEDKMLEAMELIEHEQKTLSDIEIEIVRIKDKQASEQVIVKEEVGKLDAEFSRLEKDRSVLAGQVDGELLAKYERIYTGRRGRAIVPVINGACQGCYMQLTPQAANDIMKDDLIYNCQDCGRYIYLPAPEQEN